jgi:hypothetical protein
MPRSLADLGFPSMPGGKLSDLISSAWTAVKGPGKAYNEGMTTDEMIKAGNDFAMTMGTGGSLVPKPGNSLGIFGGRLAKTADLDKLAQAEKFEKAGVPADTIWKATGWGRGKDGKWRFEIPDKGMKAKLDYDALEPKWEKQTNNSYGETPQVFRFGDAFAHPELFKAYPDLANIQLRKETSGAMGSYSPGSIRLDGARDTSTALHELQHAIQRTENFAKGTNPNAVVEQLIKELGPAHPLVQKMTDRVAQQSMNRKLYRNTAGEVESRNVETRKDFSNLQRALRSPWTTEDVPRNLQLVLGIK